MPRPTRSIDQEALRVIFTRETELWNRTYGRHYLNRDQSVLLSEQDAALYEKAAAMHAEIAEFATWALEEFKRTYRGDAS